MTSESLVPRVLWAQRHDTVFLTFEVFEVKNEKVDIKADGISFAGVRGSDDAKFAVDLQLYGTIDPEASKVSIGHREVSLILKKTESGPYWPRLLKSTQKMHFIHTDFSKWKDEDEEDEEDEAAFNQFGNFNQFGEGFGSEDANFDIEPEIEEPQEEPEQEEDEKSSEQ